MKKLSQITESNFNKSPGEDYLSLRHLDRKLQKHYNFSNDHPDNDIHKTLLKKFTQSSSDINNYQWKKHKEGHAKVYNPSRESDSSDLDEALERHKTPHKLTVYAGTKYNPEEVKNEKGIVHHPAYLSTSLSKSTAQGFSHNVSVKNNKGDFDEHRHILRINVPKGHAGAYVNHISEAGDEKEFILPRGLDLKHRFTQIHEVNRSSHDTHDNYIVHEHHMDIVPNNT